MNILNRIRHKYVNVLLLILSTLFSFGITEIAFRSLLFSDVLKYKISHHYFANRYIDDNAYRIFLKWELDGRENEPIFPNFDPIVGYTARPVTEDNPLGIIIDRKYTVDEFKGKRTMLFFGDSFIHGTAVDRIEYKIPQLLDNILDSTLVRNFGVKGYGLDQMYLRLRSVIDFFDKPHIVFGLIYPDLDRCLYEVRHAAKPYFEVAGDSLALKGVPISANYGEWLKRYPITIKSYLIAGLQGLVRRALRSDLGVRYFFNFHPSETNQRRDEEKLIVRKLIEKIKTKCDTRGAPLTFVIFPDSENMIHEGWYRKFLRQVFGELNIDYLDLTEPLRDYVKDNGLKWYNLYGSGSHPDAQDNVMITEFIADYLIERYDY